jgi:hypothetical protein
MICAVVGSASPRGRIQTFMAVLVVSGHGKNKPRYSL